VVSVTILLLALAALATQLALASVASVTTWVPLSGQLSVLLLELYLVLMSELMLVRLPVPLS